MKEIIYISINELKAPCDKLEHQILLTTITSKPLLETTLAGALGFGSKDFVEIELHIPNTVVCGAR